MTDTNFLHSNYLRYWRFFLEIGPDDHLKQAEWKLKDAEKELEEFIKENNDFLDLNHSEKRELLSKKIDEIKDNIEAHKAIMNDIKIIINKIRTTGNKLYKESEYEEYIMGLRDAREVELKKMRETPQLWNFGAIKNINRLPINLPNQKKIEESEYEDSDESSDDEDDLQD